MHMKLSFHLLTVVLSALAATSHQILQFVESKWLMCIPNTRPNTHFSIALETLKVTNTVRDIYSPFISFMSIVIVNVSKNRVEF